jgi:hypothetical protein
MVVKKRKASKAPAKRETPLPVTIGANDFESVAKAGLESVSQEDLATPRLKILQKMSPDLDTVDGAKAGMILDTVNTKVYDGSKGILLLPVAYQRQYTEWQDRGQGTGAPVAVYDAKSDILSKTTRDDQRKDRLPNGNYVETAANHFVIVVDDEKNGIGQPALITLKSTQLKKSRKWNSMMLNIKLPGSKGPFTPPMYSHLYRLKTVEEGNDFGKWFGIEIEKEKILENRNLFNMAKEFANSVTKGEKIAVPEEVEGGETNREAVGF